MTFAHNQCSCQSEKSESQSVMMFKNVQIDANPTCFMHIRVIQCFAAQELSTPAS